MILSEEVKPGTIETIVGNGTPGYAGDGGPAALACLNEPKNIALGMDGCLYVSDSENHMIRKVDSVTGTITTVAGRAVSTQSPAARTDHGPSFSEDFGDPFGGPAAETPQQFTQLADLSGTVRFTVGSGAGRDRFQGDGGPADHALLNFPSAVALDEEGHLYIADTMNHRIRKVHAETGVISTIAGTGQRRYSGDGGLATAAALHEPVAIVADHRGRLYVADQGNHRVRRIDLRTGIITTVVGTGEAAYDGDGEPAISACLSGPSGLALGPDGTLYIADTFNGRIRAVDPESGLIRTVAGDGEPYRYAGMAGDFSTSLSRPYGIACTPDDDLLITDSDNHLIRLWHRRKGIITCLAGNGTAGYGGDGGPAKDGGLNYPFGVAVDRSGNIYVADTFNHRIRVIAA
jgi:DNA-binding beta-propeller fold protein YncE